MYSSARRRSSPAFAMPTWVTPSQARPLGSATVLSADQVHQWRTAGFVAVRGIWPTELIDQLSADNHVAFPEGGSLPGEQSIGAGMEFPAYASSAVNEVALHDRFSAAAAELLGVDSPSRLRLAQAHSWAKTGHGGEALENRGERDNDDQRMHVDFPNNSITHPVSGGMDAVACLLYLDDVEGREGATAFVPCEGPHDPAYQWPLIRTPGAGGFRWINDRSVAEQYFAEKDPSTAEFRTALYAREVQVRYSVGTALLYRLDTWHRGTPLVPNATRRVQSMILKLAEADWIQPTFRSGSPVLHMYHPTQTLERLITSSSVIQRTLLGFPPPDSNYWTSATIDAVAARYPGLDPAPYRAGMASRVQAEKQAAAAQANAHEELAQLRR